MPPSSIQGYEVISDAIQDIYDEHGNVLFTINGYRENPKKIFIYHSFCILFLGLPYILFHFFPPWRAIKYDKCRLSNADIVLISDKNTGCSYEVIKTEKVKIPNRNISSIRCFMHQHTKYVWVEDLEKFATLEALVPPLTVEEYVNNTSGLFDVDYADLLKLYGPNKISVEVKSYWRLFIEEVFNPFYLFQAFSVVLWMCDEYMIYAVCVIILTLFSSITSLVQTRKQSEALHDLVESSKCHEVSVLRQDLLAESLLQQIDPDNLVPGDLIVLPASNFTMPCDAVLLTGQCIVNESVLTGESVPITKTALHSSTEMYSPESHKRQTLFAGTQVIQTRYYGGEYVLARVVRTGFDTTKGALVKSILYPSPVALDFYEDSFKFVLVLFFIATSGMAYCLYLYLSRDAPIKEILLRTLDIITIVVPPALPAAMTVGTVYSQNRLKRLGVFCTSPPRINVCGKIKLACFDKTGTLTDDYLNMNCVVPSVDRQFSESVNHISSLDTKCKLVQAMACCHSLTRIQGKLTGDPLDINMFEFTNWELEEPGENENARYDMLVPTVVRSQKQTKIIEPAEDNDVSEIGIVRQFPFSSNLQCMSVICRELTSPHMVAFTKGAPEKLQGMCLPETLPHDFSKRLSQYTTKGYRVIAIAYKDLPVKFKWKMAQKVKRDVIECELTFLGFLIMQNPLKLETTPVIRVLHNANIRTVMITGDNILTAISVARDCEMVSQHDKIFVLKAESDDLTEETARLTLEQTSEVPTENACVNFNSDHCHFALDGKTYSNLIQFYPDLLPKILVRSKIFARFQPDQKTQLVTQLQSLDYVVSMVGDGANDCGALKAAHVGVSLSQAEASVAAPFTSAIPNISCIVHLMLEGRCALVTSFSIFKYMALYSLIQFFTILILYKCHSILGDFQFLFIDLIITTTLAITLGRQGPSRKLGKTRPLSSLVSPKNVIPLILQIVTCCLIQIGALLYLMSQEWFEPIPSDTVEPVIVSWENTVLFTVSCYQYVILATVFSKGKPYRQLLITNFWFIVSAWALTAFITWMMIYPCRKLAEIMDIMYLPHRDKEQMDFRYKLLILPAVHFFLAFAIEMGVGDRVWLKKFLQFVRRKKSPKNKYKVLLQNDDLGHVFF